MDYICRRDKKALEHYDFLWGVMEENLKGLNKKKRFSQVATPLPLQQLCFWAMQEYDVAKVLLVPFRLEKMDSAVNTKNADDDTLSAFSFEDPIDTYDLLGLQGPLVPWSRLVPQETHQHHLKWFLCIIM